LGSETAFFLERRNQKRKEFFMKRRGLLHSAAAGANVFPDPATPEGRTKSAAKTEASPGHELNLSMKFPGMVLLDGRALSLPRCGSAVLWALSFCPGEWVSSEDLGTYVFFLKGTRIDRILRQMPQAIRSLIEIRKGCDKAYKLDKSVRISASISDETAKRLQDELSRPTQATGRKGGAQRRRAP
jgi:hypothetical protein